MFSAFREIWLVAVQRGPGVRFATPGSFVATAFRLNEGARELVTAA